MVQFELTELQYDSIFRCGFDWEALIACYASLTVFRFSELFHLARNLVSVFGSTYTCEWAFSSTKQNKSKPSSRITDVGLNDVIHTGI
jgi:hypothetical protein